MKLQDIPFKDDNFKQCVLATGATNSEDITRLECRKKKIKSVEGIEYLTNLTYVDLTRNMIDQADFSKNTKLEEILIGNNCLENINTSTCENLTHLEVFMNELTEIDVSNNPLLEEFWATQNELSSIDLSKNKSLVDIRVDDNNLTAIDISRMENLKKLFVDNNALEQDNISMIKTLDIEIRC